MDKETEIRKLPPSTIFKLSQLLDIDNAWQRVMAVIPNDPKDIMSDAKYSLDDMKLIESASANCNRSCSEILLDEWGTSGKNRPTLSTLLEVLVKAQFHRAAEYVAVELMHDEPPPRPQGGPAAAVDFNFNNNVSAASNQAVSENENFSDILHIPYSILVQITNNFDNTPLKHIATETGYRTVGHKLGTGAFGTVYFGRMSNGKEVAVKKLSTDAVILKKQFENEIFTLSEYRHENLVPLLGFSCDSDNHCLVYEYMSNGSLLDNLQKKDVYGAEETNLVLNGAASNLFLKRGFLHWKKRIDISVDVCRGIHYLHTFKTAPLIHRDIKTANILLNENMQAKITTFFSPNYLNTHSFTLPTGLYSFCYHPLCLINSKIWHQCTLGDFGLVKVKPNMSDSKLLTSTVFGTSAYMAPEAFRGDVSVKIDVFSFGVVLLELLTGLPPYDENRDGCDIVTYIEDIVDDKIYSLLDKKAGTWLTDVGQTIFELAQECLQEKKRRPVIQDVLNRLETLQNTIK